MLFCVSKNVKWWFILIIAASDCLAKDSQIVQKWAENLGRELWDLAKAVARPDELKDKYRSLNTRVEDKSGKELIDIISESVGRMLRRKIDAVRCIQIAAEHAAEQWSRSDWNASTNNSYVSGKYSTFFSAIEDIANVSCLNSVAEANAALSNVSFAENLLSNSSDTLKNGTGYKNPSEVCNELPLPNLPEVLLSKRSVWWNITLNRDSHFYNIPVNTSNSSVHVPTNVYPLSTTLLNTINWTQALNEIFIKNYQSDPALSWQYFGSVTGMLRQYPAMQWRTDKGADGSPVVDLYDCRTRSWFIEASTCSKDMVILLDNSGSMTGIGKTIGKATVASILETLSNNDFVNIFYYNETTDYLIRCFQDQLVQATPENLDNFKLAMDNPYIKPEGLANLTEAFSRAFDLLERYREIRGCGPNTPCNQLIMLVTDGVPGNLTEVFRYWNWRDNDTYIPVRVFTYLLGREVTKVREIQWMACLNRGYYAHIHNQEEIREQVLKYIPVVARPLVLQAKHHPTVWTHAYADISNPALATWLWLIAKEEEEKSRLDKQLKESQQRVRFNEEDNGSQQKGNEEDDAEQNPSAPTSASTAWRKYRLLTSVSIPVFDNKGNRNKRKRAAKLLGVAGTDVPIHDIERLTLPYKLGVNGYAFIVSNNGYVILHPALRPADYGQLKLNYNSVDLTEVEILDDGRGPRDPGDEVKDLRSALVDHLKGSMLEVPVKFHYDDKRRVTLERRNYFFAPLRNTPFSLGVAIPSYGTYWIKVGNEIRKNQNRNISIPEFFTGSRWRVHPDWVYCRYHYLEGHEYDTVEEELIHFLKKLHELGDAFHWADQYEESQVMLDDDEVPNCGRKTLGDDAYHCNKELMELLVFDAKATNHSFSDEYSPRDFEDQKLVEAYEVFLRFVATQSGLTRWQYVGSNDIPPKAKSTEFGDDHQRAVNEAWYKGAIFQYIIDPDSVSFTVPWEAGPDAIVTGSMAIFPRDGGKEAAAAVVGFQMPMTALFKRFHRITFHSPAGEISCQQDSIDCYLIDQNGYVIVSEYHRDTGQFLGTVDGPVMKSLVIQGVYKAVEIYDYQSLCKEDIIVGSANMFRNPLENLYKLVLWILFRLAWIASQVIDLPMILAKPKIDPNEPDPPPPPTLETIYHACDTKKTLYIMNQTVALEGVTNTSLQCSRPFYAQKVRHTNLLLVVIDTLYPCCYERLEVNSVEISPSEYPNGTKAAPCHKNKLNELPRRRLEKCYTEHPLESEIEDCGGSSTLRLSFLLFLLTIFRLIFANYRL